MIALLNRRFGGLRQGSTPKKGVGPVFQRSVKVYSKEMSEAHICIGVPGVSQVSEERYAFFVLNTILGAGVSSRLFQEIREKRGLAYSVYSFTSSYQDAGLWGVYAGVSKKRIREVAEVIIAEMRDFSRTLTDIELQRAKNHLKGNLILGLESTNSRMNNLARQEIYFGRYISPEEVLKSVDMVNIKQIRELSERLINDDMFAVTALGPLQKNILDGLVG